MTLGTGEIYRGYWKAGQKDGSGKIEYAFKEATFEGNFTKNLKNGQGVFNLNNNIFRGNYVNDLADGECTIEYANGDYFKGLYKNGMKNGIGKYIYANGDTIKGVYENDKKVEKNQYTINYMNGNVYEG